MSESWKPVVGFESSYEVSDQGVIRSIDRWHTTGAVPRLIKGQVLATAEGGRAKNYLRVMLRKGEKRVHAYVHAVVAEAFLGAKPNGTVVCHKDDNGHNNASTNLYYGSEEDNILDRHVNSLPLKTMEQAPF